MIHKTIPNVTKLNERIVLSNYDPMWPRCFEHEIEKIKKVFVNRIIATCHYGSTSVPGMKAKPVIDIMIGVSKFFITKHEIQLLEQLGYVYLGNAWTKKRFYLRKRGKQNFNLAIVKHGGKIWRNNLSVRDYLRTHPETAKMYVQVKEDAIKKSQSNLIEYSNLKYLFIQDLIKKANERTKS